MHVEIAGTRYPISNDYDPDTGQSWTWDEALPRCPACHFYLSRAEYYACGLSEVDVESDSNGTYRVRCECGHLMEIAA